MIDIETIITLLALISGFCAMATVALRAIRKEQKKTAKKARPMPPVKPPEWRMEIVSEEVAEKGNDVDRSSLFGSTYRRVWLRGAAMTPPHVYDERLTDYVLVQLIRRTRKPSDYGGSPATHTDRLRIGAVEVADPEFDSKLAELRGVAEERAMALNGVME